MLRFTRALLNLSPRTRYFCTSNPNEPPVDSLDPSIFFDRPKVKSINCLILHPVLFPNKGPETELYLAEEAIGLAKALNWNIVKGPYWQERMKTAEIIVSEDETTSDDEIEQGKGRGRNLRRQPKEGDYVYVDVFKGVYQGGAVLLDLWSSEDEEDALYNEWKNQLLRKSIAKSSLLKVRSTSNNTYFTKGKVEQLGRFIAKQDINAVYINSELSALQVRNLEKQWNDMINQYLTKKNGGYLEHDDEQKGIKVFDRFTMILQIFAKRARSRVAKLQIELAFLDFMKTKLMRQGSTFSGIYNIFDADLAKAQEVKLEIVSGKQRGGTGKLAGQGETQLEVEKRLIADKEAKIRKELVSEANLRQRLRIKRKENINAVPTIALIGYTNAGKSALMNRLTNAGVESEDRLFQTLSTTSKKIKLKSGQMGILLDTIGFITNLPHDLIESFKCTLEEVQDADLVLHIRDINHPHTEDQKKTVLKVLKDLGFDETFYTKKMIEVWNKIDLLDDDINQDAINNSEVPIIPISALDGTNCGQLVNTITTRVNELMGKKTFKFVHSPEKHQDRLNWLYKNANIANVENFNYNQKPTKEYPNGKITFELSIDEVTFKRYEAHFGMKNEKLEKSKKDEIPEEWLKGSKSFFDRKNEENEKVEKSKKDEIPEEWLKGSKSYFDRKKEEANKKSPNKK